MSRYDSDHVASDDLDHILEFSRQSYEQSARSEQLVQAGPSKKVLSRNGSEQCGRQNAGIQSRIAELDADVRGYQHDIATIEDQIAICLQEKEILEKQLEQSLSHRLPNGQGKAGPGINYSTEKFDWSGALKTRMKAVFGIDDFRLCQQGACNANMDGRDIVCIMPTGGGKSLTYQLPAIITPGCTLVISPLISLMTDQILHLRDNEIEAAMITSATSKSQKAITLDRLKSMADRKHGHQDKELKLIYVTPEKISKDKSFRALLQRLDESRRLSRIVIDEAHCVSQLGHDFRPDYKELHILRKILPRVPIMALSATCGPEVLKDLINILGLKEPVDGNDAPGQGTVYFSSPLYRKNLHYRVVAKPDKAADHLETMKDYILEHHPNDTGIIYCFTVKDTLTVAEKLKEISGGKIKTGVYNAQIPDAEKMRLQLDWRKGVIKVVCATIAFGLGIDKGDVRYVLHHSISKSLEGFYQESGRAGRDGKDSDCILYYRPQDVSVIGGIMASEKEGRRKLHAIVKFAEEVKECRKVSFAKYFSHSSQLSITSFATEEVGALDPCRHCDNCIRSSDTIEPKDVTLATWQILKVVNAVQREGGRLTLSMLATLARGGNKGAFEASQGRRKEAVKHYLDIKAVAGGPVDLNKNDVEHLLVYLLTQDYLKEEYLQTAHKCVVYVVAGRLAARISHLSRESIENSSSPRLEFDFIKSEKKQKTTKKTIVSDKSSVPKKRISAGSSKGKGKAVADDDDDDTHDDDISSDDELPYEVTASLKSRAAGPSKRTETTFDSEDMYASGSDDDVESDWVYSIRDGPRPKRRKKAGGEHSGGFTTKVVQEGEREVMILSSD